MNNIEFIKDEFLKPNPILYLCRGIPEQSLASRDFSTATDIVKTDSQNEVSQLTFSIPFNAERKIGIDDCEKLVKFENTYYIIKEIDIDDSGTRSITVTCESENTELKGVYCEPIDKIGSSPYEMYQAIMTSAKHPIDLGSSYKWLGTDIVNKFRHLQCEDEKSVFENLCSMAEIFNSWLEFSTDESGQNWIFLRSQEIDDNKFIKKNLDMKTLNINSNSKEIFTQVEMFGAQDELTGNEITIMSVNPTGRSYLENYSWHLAKGIPISNINNEAKYQQLKIIRDDKYTSPQELYNMGLEELAKCSIPLIDASLSMSDLSIYIDSPITAPRVGQKLLCINKDIDFIFTCKIVGVERPYNNPAGVNIQISNVNRYNTQFQQINHTVTTVDKVVGTNPTNVDGENTGDGKPYIPMCNVKDGDHVNATKRFADTSTLITQTGEKIQLEVTEIDNSVAILEITANQIRSRVEDISDTSTQVYSEIQQTSRNIRAVVAENSETGEIELNKDAFVVAFNGSTNRKAVIDRTNGLYLGNIDTGTYSKIGYDGRLELYNGVDSMPYHCLMAVGSKTITCTADAYTEIYVNLPSRFQGIADSNIQVICSIKKVYDTNIDNSSNLPYWFGCYASVVSNQIVIEAMSKWRTISYASNDTDTWVEDINGESGGMLDVSWVAIA